MAELEIHHEGGEEGHDPMGQRVGIMAAVLAVLLAIVTIASHRTHTDAIIARSEANDKWQQYQSTRVKFHSLELGADLMGALAPANAEEKLKKYEKDKSKQEEKGKDIMKEAREKEDETGHAEAQALRYDIGEGLLEIALVLSSLYFISHKKLFPAVGVIAGLAGLVIAITGFLK
jgi:uncharacterized protein DUF4337